jgi:subtilase family serine protease
MLDGFAQSDIDGYAKQTKQTFLTVQIVPAKTKLTPGGEGTLDVEAVLSLAPAAQVVAFVGWPNPTAIYTNMTDNDDIKQFTSSWFWYNGTTTDQNLMLQLAAQGQSFFQATGDSGSYPPKTFAKCVSGSMDDRTFPAITLVGGTDLSMSGKGTTYTGETAWGGSSGGYIECNPLPAYQAGIASINGASGVYQNAPDVSAQSQDILLYFEGKSSNWLGTSLATPLWAGFMALVNELAANDGKPSVGFAGPALYAIAATSNYDTDFHDITSGCATNKSGPTYCAGVGYDLVTGLGSPQHALIFALSGVPSFPLYCQGPLTTSSGSTPFKWASQAAGTASPGPGECAWADRRPRGTEIQPGDGNLISGTRDQVANLASRNFAEVGVYSDPVTNQLVVTQIVGLVSPPFLASPTLP